ncbi:uncharacterized protein [Ranitomeya imitator]|uniref:uncharacterized protein n=1 Tax=Ranitomeya imitator TaxID=111125 RepID=UPI0037E73038
MEGNSRGLQETVATFKDLLRKRTKVWWNHAFLDKYLQKGLIPRGLRVQVFPSFPVDDVAIRERWEECASKCSVGFMEILKEMNASSLKEMETEIESLQAVIKTEMSGETLKKFKEEVDKEVQKWVEDIQQVKSKEFQRDSNDRQMNKMYRWRNGNERSRPFFRNESRSRSRSTSYKSTTSMEERHGGKKGLQDKNNEGPHGSDRMTTRQNVKKGTVTKQSDVRAQGGLQVINLSDHVLTNCQLRVLGRGLSFSPTNGFNFFTALKDLHLFSRKLVLKKLHFGRGHGSDPLGCTEEEALRILEELLEEQTTTSGDCFVCVGSTSPIDHGGVLKQAVALYDILFYSLQEYGSWILGVHAVVRVRALASVPAPLVSGLFTSVDVDSVARFLAANHHLLDVGRATGW